MAARVLELLPVTAVLPADPTGVVALVARELPEHSGRSAAVASLAVMSGATTLFAVQSCTFPLGWRDERSRDIRLAVRIFPILCLRR